MPDWLVAISWLSELFSSEQETINNIKKVKNKNFIYFIKYPID
ncbi:hypothetical protein BN3087_380051 [Sulfurovum sp. enrichment culture clone C5]|uniref:Uncharacterized protein n=1 Tax=Sulfurovum sp. enrichment culture clone C5 TaxID=497650 RepID=A0A0S4XMM4_9BACT|nr:hypothetical protein BN3087_380051 [Sulfurovum sp. enrichment culture clone C5]